MRHFGNIKDITRPTCLARSKTGATMKHIEIKHLMHTVQHRFIQRLKYMTTRFRTKRCSGTFDHCDKDLVNNKYTVLKHIDIAN